MKKKTEVDFVMVNLRDIPTGLIGKKFGVLYVFVEGHNNHHIKQKCQAIKKAIKELKKTNELWKK